MTDPLKASLKSPHCALVIGKTNSGKTKWILDLLETSYLNAFESIVIICPTVSKNVSRKNVGHGGSGGLSLRR